MKKKLHNGSPLNLLAILISVLFGSTDLKAQIVYTEVATYIDLYYCDCSLDLNTDGINEFHFTSVFGGMDYRLILECLSSQERIVGYIDQDCYNIGFASPLNLGEVIDVNQYWMANGNSGYLFNWFFDCNNYGDWLYEGDRYMGLTFKIGNNQHFAWARILNGHYLTGYAYNTTPNAPILAGQTTLEVQEFDHQTLKLVVRDKIIHLFNINPNSFFKLYDLSGQMVQNNHFDNKVAEIDCTTLSSGFYVLEIRDIDDDQIVRKKIIID